MAAVIALLLALLALQCAPTSDHHVDVATTQRMQQREEYLRQEMTRLLQEIKQRSQRDLKQRDDEAMRLSVWQQWLLWNLAAALLLLAAGCWPARDMKLTSHRCREQDTSSHEKEDKEEEDKDLSGAHHRVSSLDASTPSPTWEIF